MCMCVCDGDAIVNIATGLGDFALGVGTDTAVYLFWMVSKVPASLD